MTRRLWTSSAALAIILDGCGGGGGGSPLPGAFAGSAPIATVWSVEVHPNEPVEYSAAALAALRPTYSAVRIDYELSAGTAFYDTLTAAAQANNLGIDFITPYPADVPASAATPQGYAALCGAAAGRYRGHGYIWEIINEPDAQVPLDQPTLSYPQYIAIAAATAQAIRAADPTAVILTGGTSGLDANAGFFYAISAGRALAPYINGVAIHPYGYDVPTSIRTVAAATHLPVYVTEDTPLPPAGAGLTPFYNHYRN